jgi:hypothetical protein
VPSTNSKCSTECFLVVSFIFASDPAEGKLGNEVPDSGCCMHGHYIFRQGLANDVPTDAPSPYGVSEDRVVGDRRRSLYMRKVTGIAE